ncbi:MAG: hypothetical protein WAM88_06010 [Nitrososphaeraceae archaeon]
MSAKSEYLKDSKVDWRRNKVLELSSQGYSQRDIASTLQVGLGTVNKDILFLNKSRGRIYNIILMKEYQKNIKTV